MSLLADEAELIRAHWGGLDAVACDAILGGIYEDRLRVQRWAEPVVVLTAGIRCGWCGAVNVAGGRFLCLSQQGSVAVGCCTVCVYCAWATTAARCALVDDIRLGREADGTDPFRGRA